jgi:GNAT superfamily N-acetyltransferase
MKMLTIAQATDDEGIARAQRLFLEYNATIAVDLEFQGFDHELATLPGRYAPPAGRLLLALRGHEPVGCVALRPLEAGVGELKRLYVRPAFQGRGIARLLVERTIVEARAAGYHTMRLDTLPAMERARALYEALGFRQIPAYTAFSAVPGTTFYELDLRVLSEQR